LKKDFSKEMKGKKGKKGEKGKCGFKAAFRESTGREIMKRNFPPSFIIWMIHSAAGPNPKKKKI